ncbi:MAG: restriction endonuclease [Ardenticatenaceae bacterium]|nr:restriction endonuclease [Ardenticatenaceae bacterium]
MSQQAFVLRIAPGGIDKVPEALACNEIIIGWALAKGLLDENLSWEQFREIIRVAYYVNEINLRKAGAAAGHMWRFVREMNIGDLVVVPYGTEFYVAEVTSNASHNTSKVEEDSAYRRSVRWLNDRNPIPRSIAKSALVSRMKTQGTCASATDLISQIKECIQIASSGLKPTFQNDLQDRLVKETLDELRSGRLDSFGFERLIQNILIGLGADEARIVPRNQDKGADIVATFLVAGAFQQVLAVQAKHWQPDPPVGREVVNQLIKGIEAESANLGMVITSGAISPEAVKVADEYYEEKGIKIELVDGEQFAQLIVEHGIQAG